MGFWEYWPINGKSPNPSSRLQYETLLQLLRNRRPVRVTGGEPFLDPELPSLLQLLQAKKESFSFAAISNGTLIGPEIIELLRFFLPLYVQVSLDGIQPIHDGIPGPGAFEKAIQGIRHLVDAGIRTLVSFTAYRTNYRELPRVAAWPESWERRKCGRIG